jgi:uncharacterized protein (DUF305 family)
VKITIDRKTGALLAIIVLLGATAISMSISRNDNGMNSGHMGGHSASQSDGNLTGADLMFLQMMIPHHQQAVDISELALARTEDPELTALAKAIANGQRAEIVQMKSWLKDAGASEDMGHAMHEMGGMLSDEDLAGLTNARGKSFDILWLQGMTAHHDGALHMVQMIEDADNPEIKTFGKAIVIEQSAQIEQMKTMLERLSR